MKTQEDRSETMNSLPNQSFISVEEYLELDLNNHEICYEYIDGQLRLLAGGSLNHSMIAANLIYTLRGLLQGKHCHVFTSDAHVQVSETRYFHPNVTVSCDARDRGRQMVLRSPLVVFEVLSPSTEDYDHSRKFIYYRECPTIQEYTLVDSFRHSIEVCRRETEKLWMLHTYELGDEIELRSLGISFSVADVYEDIVFPSDDEIEPA
jgi:Uma2 family endonuclease